MPVRFTIQITGPAIPELRLASTRYLAPAQLKLNDFPVI
jgi:hypothetical protein